MKILIKPIAIILLSMLFNGCAIHTDMYGRQVDITKEYFLIKSLEREQVNQDIFYIKCLIPEPVWGVAKVKQKQNFSIEMKKIADNYGYCCYLTIETIPDNLSGAYNYYIYQMRFFKTEKEFDKWIERYRG
jgi:hypothetical protein